MRPFRIAITGVESTGKTTLTAALGVALGGQTVREVARYDRDVIAGDVSPETLTRLGHEQLVACGEAEAEANRRGAEIVITDSDDTVLRVWGVAVFGEEPSGLEGWENWADLTLLCAPTIPWEPDPLRAVPDLAERLTLHEAYLKCLDDGRRWALIDAPEKAERLDQAVRAFRACIPGGA